jgi:hypothetical protein
MSSCDLNQSMQHLISHYREGDVENEVQNEDLLLGSPEGLDVGAMAEG